MKNRRLLFLLFVIAIVSGAELFVVLTTIPPREASTGVLWVLYISMLAFIGTLLSFMWHPLKTAIYRSNSISRFVSVRQSYLLAVVITSTLFFKSLGILNIWDVVPLALSTVLIEFFFQADKKSHFHES